MASQNQSPARPDVVSGQRGRNQRQRTGFRLTNTMVSAPQQNADRPSQRARSPEVQSSRSQQNQTSTSQDQSTGATPDSTSAQGQTSRSPQRHHSRSPQRHNSRSPQRQIRPPVSSNQTSSSSVASSSAQSPSNPSSGSSGVVNPAFDPDPADPGRPPRTNEPLPDLLHSHMLPPYVQARRNQHRSRHRSRNHNRHRSRHRRGRGEGTTQLEDAEGQAGRRGCCMKCVTAATTFRWVLVGLALLGVCCVLTGIILGALHMTVGNSFLTLSLMFIGLGVMLVVVVGIGWKCTPQGHEPCHLLFNLGNHSRNASPRRTPRSHHRHRNHWHGGVLYPEFRHRRPPPSYNSSQQEYEQQMAQQNESAENGDNYSLPSSPPPTYRSRASTVRTGVEITFPPQPDSRPPTYRSHISDAAEHSRPALPREEQARPSTSTERTAGPETSTERSTGPATSTERAAGLGTSTGRTAGPGTSTGRTAGPGTSTGRTTGPGTSTGRTAGPGTSTGRTAGPRTSARRTAGPGASAGRTAGPGTSTGAAAADQVQIQMDEGRRSEVTVRSQAQQPGPLESSGDSTSSTMHKVKQAVKMFDSMLEAEERSSPSGSGQRSRSGQGSAGSSNERMADTAL